MKSETDDFKKSLGVVPGEEDDDVCLFGPLDLGEGVVDGFSAEDVLERGLWLWTRITAALFHLVVCERVQN